jgi:hypothetical protein
VDYLEDGKFTIAAIYSISSTLSVGMIRFDHNMDLTFGASLIELPVDS